MRSEIRTVPFHRFLTAGLALAVATTGAACSSSTEPEVEPDAVTMRIIAGDQTVDVRVSDGQVTGGPITIGVGSTAIEVQFLLDNGQPDPVVTAAQFRADVEPTNEAVVTFARTGPFTGTLTGVATGQTAVTFSLFHLPANHEEFDHPVTVVVE